MLDTSIEISGLRELEKNLLALGAEVGSKALTGALRDAAKPMEDDMIANAPVGDYEFKTVETKKGGTVRITPGFIKSRIKRRAARNRKGSASKKFDKNTTAIVRVGVFRVPYIVAVEYGTSMSRKQGGYTKAHPFIRGAADKSDEVVTLFKGRLQRRIYLAARRIARQQARAGR